MLLLREELTRQCCLVRSACTSCEICLHREEMLMLCVRNCSQLCSAYMYVHRHLSQLTPRSHILHALSVIVIIISLIVVKCSKANTNAIGDTDCKSKLT